MAYPKEHGGTVDVFHLKVRALIEAQTTGINHRQSGSGHWILHSCQQMSHFFRGKDQRQFLPLLGAYQIENRELSPQSLFKEELDAAKINVDGASGSPFVIYEMQEKITNLFFAELIGPLVVVPGKTSYCVAIGLLSPFREAI